MSYHSRSFSAHHSSQGGFSLLEVLISLAIIVIIVSVSLVRYEAFNSEVILRSQAYEVALSIREAQVQTVGALGEGGGFREEYGVYFDVTTPDRYLFFIDNGGSEPVMYDEGEEINPVLYLDTRYTISRICVNSCSAVVDDLSVYFIRPDFDAHFSSQTPLGTISDARIEIEPVSGASSGNRAVVISQTGQISID